MNMTDEQVIEIYEYCIGALVDVPLHIMRQEVKKFINDVGDVTEEVTQLKEAEHSELMLNGYFDY